MTTKALNKYTLTIEDDPVVDGGIRVTAVFDPPLPNPPPADFEPSPAQVFAGMLQQMAARLLQPPPPKDDNIIELPPRDILLPNGKRV